MADSEITAREAEFPLGESILPAHEGQNGECHVHETPQELQEHVASTTIVSMDTLGIVASSVCLVHCLAMPFIIGFLPMLGLQFLQGHFAHVVLAGFVVSFGLFAIVPGYLKHRNKVVLGLMSLGLATVFFATFGADPLLGESWEVPLITVGNLILVGTHLRNRALSKCQGHVH